VPESNVTHLPRVDLSNNDSIEDILNKRDHLPVFAIQEGFEIARTVDEGKDVNFVISDDSVNQPIASDDQFA